MDGVCPAELSPLQRGLLVVDGTVTTFLEAWALEPILVTRLWQRASRLESADPWLCAHAGDGVLDRAVLLTGARSRRCFAFAESRILVERLPAAMRRDLDLGTAGLGQILLRSSLESRREGLWYGRERGRPVPPQVAALACDDFLVRTYRVSTGGQPLMMITERFPYADPGFASSPPAA
jgi:chorismate-pyruvate lyase